MSGDPGHTSARSPYLFLKSSFLLDQLIIFRGLEDFNLSLAWGTMRGHSIVKRGVPQFQPLSHPRDSDQGQRRRTRAATALQERGATARSTDQQSRAVGSHAGPLRWSSTTGVSSLQHRPFSLPRVPSPPVISGPHLSRPPRGISSGWPSLTTGSEVASPHPILPLY